MSRKSECETQRVPVDEAAQIIGCHPDYLKMKMRKKKWDLGRVEYPEDKKNGQCTYFIFRPKLEKFIGCENKDMSIERKES